jgi:hypothetical protein
MWLRSRLAPVKVTKQPITSATNLTRAEHPAFIDETGSKFQLL